MPRVTILVGDCRETLARLPAGLAACCVTSPPYLGRRKYLPDGHPDAALEIGREATPDGYVATLVSVFGAVRRVLSPRGTLWANIGDAYAQRACEFMGCAIKPKDLLMLPTRAAAALQADGWWLRSHVIWHKCLSGGEVVYAKTQKGEMPMAVKDMVRLNPATVKLWDGQKWNQAVSWERTQGDPNRKEKLARAKRMRLRGIEAPVEGDVEIELRSGERIGCTRQHRWPTRRGIVGAGSLRIGDVIDSCVLPEPDTARMPSCLDDGMVGWFIGLYIAEGCRSRGTILISSHRKETERFRKLEEFAAAYDGTCILRPDGDGNAVVAALHGPILNAIIDAYVSGRTAKDKHLNPRCWRRSNGFLRAVLDGYLSGDGTEGQDGRWRLRFCSNDALASDLRVVSARIGASVRLRRTIHPFRGRKSPGWQGSLYFDPARRKNPDTEIIAIRASRARTYYDISLAEDPHLFALGSGVLTHNSNPMPERVADRPVCAHESVFLLTPSADYHYDAGAVREAATMKPQRRSGKRDYGDGGVPKHRRGTSYVRREEAGIDSPDGKRHIRNVWSIPTQPFRGAHFAPFPEALVEPCLRAGCPAGGVALDPFGGSGTVGVVAHRLGLDALLCELNPAYAELARERLLRSGVPDGDILVVPPGAGMPVAA